VDGTVTYDSATQQATFTPAAQLASAATYTAKVTADVAAADGGRLESDYAWSFTTARVAWISEGGSLVEVSSAQEELHRVDQINCKPFSAYTQFALDEQSGRLWTGDTNNDRVLGFDANGRLLASFPQVSAQGTALDPRDGSWWSSEYGTTRKLVKRNAIGLKVVETADGLSGSMMDNAMAWCPDDNSLWFADYGTYVYKVTGTDAELAGYNLNAASGAHHLRLGPLGQAFEVSCQPGTGQVWAADRNGAAVRYASDGTEVSRMTLTDLPGFSEVDFISTDASGVWLGAVAGSRVGHYTNAGVSLYNGSIFPRTLEVDPDDGGAWVGTDTSLLKLDAAGQQEWARNNGLVRSIAVQKQTIVRRTVHVAIGGSDADGQGTLASPYATIAKGIAAASSGDTVSVAAGTYHENINLKSGVSLAGAGQATTVIQGSGAGNVVDGAGVQNLMVSGFTITGAGQFDAGFYCAGCSGIIVRGNALVDNSDSANGVTILGDTSGVLLEQNVITGNGEDGILLEGPGIVRNNVIARNADAGIYVRLSSPAYITNNVIDGNGTAAGGRSGIMAFLGSHVISNNIISNNGNNNPNAGLAVGIYVGSGAVALSYNDVFGNFQGPYTGIAAGNGDLAVDPLFVDSAHGDYHLQAGSPGRNAGDPALNDAGVSCSDVARRSDMGAYGGPWSDW
jgi:hypothetical protein